MHLESLHNFSYRYTNKEPGRARMHGKSTHDHELVYIQNIKNRQEVMVK